MPERYVQMTRKDYRIIAEALRESRPVIVEDTYAQWTRDAETMAQNLYVASVYLDVNGNSRHSFDAAKFGATCGLIPRTDGSLWPRGSHPTTAQILR